MCQRRSFKTSLTLPTNASTTLKSSLLPPQRHLAQREKEVRRDPNALVVVKQVRRSVIQDVLTLENAFISLESSRISPNFSLITATRTRTLTSQSIPPMKRRLRMASSAYIAKSVMVAK